jgi:hypothetical protein
MGTTVWLRVLRNLGAETIGSLILSTHSNEHTFCFKSPSQEQGPGLSNCKMHPISPDRYVSASDILGTFSCDMADIRKTLPAKRSSQCLSSAWLAASMLRKPLELTRMSALSTQRSSACSDLSEHLASSRHSMQSTIMRGSSR